MSITIELTLYLWWLWAYLAAGGALFVPLGWALNRGVTPRQPFWRVLRRYWRRVPVWIFAWPVSAWAVGEQAVNHACRRRRKARR